MWIGYECYEGTAYIYGEQGRIILIMCCSSAAGCRHTGWVKIYNFILNGYATFKV